MKKLSVLTRTRPSIGHFLMRKPGLIWINLLLSKRCTQKCLHCSIPIGATKADDITPETFYTIIDHLEKYGTQVITLSGGDPMLHPLLPEFVSYLHKRKFARIHLLTTLYGKDVLIEKTIDLVFKYHLSMSISFDGFGDTVDHIRGAKHVAERVERNMRIVFERNRNLKKRVPVGANIIINRLNLSQVPKILDLLESLNWPTDIDIYRWAATNQRETDELKIEDSPELRKVLQRAKSSPVVFTPSWLIDGFPAYLRSEAPKYCPYLSAPTLGSKFFIDPNGDVKVCLGGAIGNLLSQTPDEIFSSDAWEAKRNEFIQCKGCWNTCYTTSARLLHWDNILELLKAYRIAK